MFSVPGLGGPELVGLGRGGQPGVDAPPAQGRSGWGRAGLEVPLGAGGVETAILLCFHITLALSWLQTPPLQQPAHPPSQQWTERRED